MEEPSPVEMLDPQKIDFDPKNPRGETREQIESDVEFKDLIESVKNHNILVPLIVRNNPDGNKPYKLLDGERRLRAALITKKELVPAYLIKDDEVDGRILAYHIHMLRKQWDKKSELTSIKEIRDELLKKDEGISENELFKKLLEITTHKEHELKDLLALLKYDEQTIKKVQDGEILMSYLIQIESSFLSPLKREFPKLYNKYGEENLRGILIKKVENGKLGGTRYLMDNVLKFFKDRENKNKFKNAIKNFLDDPNEDISRVIQKLERKPAYRKRSKRSTASTKTGMGTPVPTPIDHKSKLAEIEKNIIKEHVFDLIFNYLYEATIAFEKRTGTKFSNESELQKFIYAVLRSLFVSVEFEDPTEKRCERSSRLDFVLKDHKIIIEVKFVRDQKHAKEIYNELAEDYPKYSTSPYGETIINYIYDPDKNIANHEQFKKELYKLLPNAQHYIQ